MPVTSSIPDSDRYASYEPVDETTNFPVGFVLFTGDAEEAKSEIEVKIDGVILDPADFSLQGTFDLTTDYPVCTDAEVVLPAGVTGVQLEIEGKKVIERVAQLPSGQGVAPHYWNVILNRVWAILRENRQRLDRVPMLPYGETPPTAEEMLAWRDYVVDPGAVISVNGETGAVEIDKESVGLGNVPNYPVASEAEAEAGGASDKLMTPQRTAEAIAALAPGVTLPPGFLFGLTLSNNGSDATNDLDVAVGRARDSTDAADLVLAGALTKRLDAAWVVGTNQGGMMGGLTKANSTWYAVHLIRRTDTGVVDIGFHTSGTAPTLPTNYTQFRRIGWIRTSGAGAILAFVQNGDRFRYPTMILDVDEDPPATSGQTVAVSAPPLTFAIIRALYDRGGATLAAALVTAIDESSESPSTVNGPSDLGWVNAGIAGSAQMDVRTNASSQIRYRSTHTAPSHMRIFTRGWLDDRGRLA